MDAKWEDMTPEERNALVAEKVMGWERNTAWYTTGAPEELVGKVAWDGWQTGPTPHDITVDLPLFTTDIAAAWRVVEEIVKSDVVVSGGVTPANRFGLIHYDDEGIFEASFVFDYPEAIGGCYADCIGNTAPEAICIAALRAKGVDV